MREQKVSRGLAIPKCHDGSAARCDDAALERTCDAALKVGMRVWAKGTCRSGSKVKLEALGASLSGVENRPPKKLR